MDEAVSSPLAHIVMTAAVVAEAPEKIDPGPLIATDAKVFDGSSELLQSLSVETNSETTIVPVSHMSYPQQPVTSKIQKKDRSKAERHKTLKPKKPSNLRKSKKEGKGNRTKRVSSCVSDRKQAEDRSLLALDFLVSSQSIVHDHQQESDDQDERFCALEGCPKKSLRNSKYCSDACAFEKARLLLLSLTQLKKQKERKQLREKACSLLQITSIDQLLEADNFIISHNSPEQEAEMTRSIQQLLAELRLLQSETGSMLSRRSYPSSIHLQSHSQQSSINNPSMTSPSPEPMDRTRSLPSFGMLLQFSHVIEHDGSVASVADDEPSNILEASPPFAMASAATLGSSNSISAAAKPKRKNQPTATEGVDCPSCSSVVSAFDFVKHQQKCFRKRESTGGFYGPRFYSPGEDGFQNMYLCGHFDKLKRSKSKDGGIANPTAQLFDPFFGSEYSRMYCNRLLPVCPIHVC